MPTSAALSARPAITAGSFVGKASSAAIAVGSPATLFTTMTAAAFWASATATLLPKVQSPRDTRAMLPATEAG